VVAGIGRVLIATGLVMFGFVAYQLWGTAIEYHQSQDRLAEEFDQLLAATTTSAAATSATTTTAATPTTTATTVASSAPSTSTSPSSPTSTAPNTIASTTAAAPTTVAPPPSVLPGEALARLEIPRIGVKAYVVQGVQPADLKHGPGHYPDTPWPGQLGNSAVAGHRTTYGQPFYRLDEVRPGDEIVVTTVQGRFVYRATGSEVVSPSQSDVVATTDPDLARLTLTTCTPRYTASQRLIVFADLDAAASAAPQAPIVETPSTAAPRAGVPSTPPTPRTPSATDDPAIAATPSSEPTTSGAPGSTTTTQAPAIVAPAADAGSSGTESADAFAHGWFSDDAAFGQVALWGLAVTAVSIGAWLLSRRVRRDWVGALVGIVPFVVALYFFFQNVNRLLPAAL
jgi:sortase A